MRRADADIFHSNPALLGDLFFHLPTELLRHGTNIQRNDGESVGRRVREDQRASARGLADACGPPLLAWRLMESSEFCPDGRRDVGHAFTRAEPLSARSNRNCHEQNCHTNKERESDWHHWPNALAKPFHRSLDYSDFVTQGALDRN